MFELRSRRYFHFAIKPVMWGLALACLGHSSDIQADEKKSEKPKPSYQKIVLSDEPVAYWRFDDANPKQAVSLSAANSASLIGRIIGSVQFDAPGPRTERFPLFKNDNKAALFDGKHGFIDVDDPGQNSLLDFQKGDSLTLEAWVNLKSLSSGRYGYVVGKGRTNNKGFDRENQNYALRLFSDGSVGCLSFLFRNAENRSGTNDDFHRWTSTLGIHP
ncbi:MAG: hypothetical protein IID46_11500, partial [Planctomycetes bacterium]|nr:hypothetical protein [Planctomycetota bacterium]